MKTFKTFLPVFPGFYNTIFESDYEDQEVNDINNQRSEKGLKPIAFDDCIFNYAEYEKNVSQECTYFIEYELKKLNVITSMKFEALISPKEYNFYNDSINIEVNLTDENIKVIKKYIFDNLDMYKQYLKDNYTSCSGFISFFPNDLEGWQELTNDFNNFDEKSHLLGSILEFICEINNIDQDEMYDNIETINICVDNYDELIDE